MPHADVNEQRIYFEDTGGDGPPVILAHGFLMDHEMFAPQVAALAPTYRVITWDERGFGADRVRRPAVQLLGLGQRLPRRCSTTSASTGPSSAG